MEDIDKVKQRIKLRKKNKYSNKPDQNSAEVANKKFNKLYKLVIRSMFVAFLALSYMTYTKATNTDYNQIISNLKKINFKAITKDIGGKIGSILPFEGIFKQKDLTVSSNEPYVLVSDDFYKNNSNQVGSVGEGLVISKGEDSKTKKTIIVEQANGVKVTYGHLTDITIDLYDRVIKDEVIGTYTEKVHLGFLFEDKKIDYETAQSK